MWNVSVPKEDIQLMFGAKKLEINLPLQFLNVQNLSSFLGQVNPDMRQNKNV